jgi:flagella basal body P-ring formation protein FlgA
MKLFFKTLFFLLAISPLVCTADNRFESHQTIKQKASAFLATKLDGIGNEYSLQIRPIDQRLKLKKCPSEIAINLPSNTVKPGRNTLSVSCTSDTSWRVFMSAYVKLFAYVIASKHPLNKGHLIQKNDLVVKKIEVTNVRSSYLTNIALAINKVLKRRVNRGDIISVNNLAKPILVNKGDTITILAKNNGFQISMKGTALTAGGKGDKIRVKNIRTKRTIQGTVFDKHTVKVNI